MVKITVYEKPTCTTCRNLTKMFIEKGIDWNKVNYFIEPFTEEKLRKLIKKTGLRPYDVLRRAEPDFKGLGITADTPDHEVISEMVKYPSIIQRPIVENRKSCRPCSSYREGSGNTLTLSLQPPASILIRMGIETRVL